MVVVKVKITDNLAELGYQGSKYMSSLSNICFMGYKGGVL